MNFKWYKTQRNVINAVKQIKENRFRFVRNNPNFSTLYSFCIYFKNKNPTNVKENGTQMLQGIYLNLKMLF